MLSLLCNIIHIVWLLVDTLGLFKMTKLFLFTLSLLFVVQLARNQDCHGSQFRIRNRVNNSVLADDGTGTLDSVYGILDICFNNTYTSVCNTTNVNTSEVARIACQNLGYDYG